jgi:hypothetical protein
MLYEYIFIPENDIYQQHARLWCLYTVGAISVAPLCILSRPFELNNVDLI